MLSVALALAASCTTPAPSPASERDGSVPDVLVDGGDPVTKPCPVHKGTLQIDCRDLSEVVVPYCEITGNLVIKVPSDASARCESLTRVDASALRRAEDVIIRARALEQVDLSSLEGADFLSVDGVSVSGLALPNLKRVRSMELIGLAGAAGAVSLPKLETVDVVSLYGDLESISFPALKEVGFFRVGGFRGAELNCANMLPGLPSEESFSLVLRSAPALTRVACADSALLQNLELANLPLLSDLQVRIAPSLSFLKLDKLPALKSFQTLDALESVSSISLSRLPHFSSLGLLPNLHSVTTMRLRDLDSFTALADADFTGLLDLEICGMKALTTVGFPNLESVDSLRLGQCANPVRNFGEMDDVAIDVLTDANPLLSSVAFPRLATADLVLVHRAGGLTSIAKTAFPILSTVGEVSIVGSEKLASIELPALKSVGYSGLRISGPGLSNLRLPRLEDANRLAVLDTALERLDASVLPKLRRVSLLIVHNAKLQALDLPDVVVVDYIHVRENALLTVARTGALADSPTLQEVIAEDNPVLAEVDFQGRGGFVGSPNEEGTLLRVERNTELTRLNLPGLTEAEYLEIAKNPKLEELALSAMKDVGSAHVVDNAQLPSCVVDAFAAQLGRECVETLEEAFQDKNRYVVCKGNTGEEDGCAAACCEP